MDETEHNEIKFKCGRLRFDALKLSINGEDSEATIDCQKSYRCDSKVWTKQPLFFFFFKLFADIEL